MIVYFSGTGNSRYTAQFLAEKLQEQMVDAGAWIKGGKRASLRSEKPWIFVSPTYGWRIPRVLEAWIRAGDFRGCRDAYFVMTCGDGIGAVPEKNRKLCGQKAFSYLGTAKVVMPENYLAMFSVPGEAEAAEIRRHAKETMDGVVEKIRKKDMLPEPNPGLAGHLCTSFVNPLFYRFCIKARPFHVEGNCVSCGACAEACPLNNIRLVDGKPQWGKACTHCMACICGCPTEAIEYGSRSKGKTRYRCPAYKSGN